MPRRTTNDNTEAVDFLQNHLTSISTEDRLGVYNGVPLRVLQHLHETAEQTLTIPTSILVELTDALTRRLR